MGDWTGVLWCRKNFNVLGITSSCFHSSRRKQWMLGLFEGMSGGFSCDNVLQIMGAAEML